MASRMTHAEYVERLNQENPNIIVLEHYVNIRTKILHKCLLCNHEWLVKPDSLLNKHGCPICNSKAKDHNTFVNELHKNHPEIEVLSEYMGNKTKVKIKHLDCGHIEYKLPTSLVCKYRGCYLCSKTAKITDEEFKSRVKKMNPFINVIGEYKNSTTNILCECVIDGYRWYATPHYISHTSNVCPKCSKIVSHTKEEVNSRLIERGIQLLDECKKIHDKHNFKCMKCGSIFNSGLNSVLNNNTGCSKCNKSIGENIIEEYLIRNHYVYIAQKTFENLVGVKGRKLSYDFYLPSYNLLIEFQGKQHYEAIDYFGGEEQFLIRQEHDKRKKYFAEQNNINFLEILYIEKDNISSILEDKLMSLKNNKKSA